MTETQDSIDLVGLFEAAAQAVAAQKDGINALDGYNGNHGDNMVQNVRLITDAVRAHKSDPPDEALRYAGAKLREQGQGGTSQFYSRGLLQAADQFAGKTELKAADGILDPILLGAIARDILSPRNRHQCPRPVHEYGRSRWGRSPRRPSSSLEAGSWRY